MGEKENNRNKAAGITLIALVVTIIVLLILAGISVQMLTGNNGVLQRAAEAKENTEQSQIEEQRRLASMEAAINVTETTFQGVKIPAGFAPTRIEGESTVEKGLVITDSKGNEFVWIEVPKSVTASVTEDNDIYDALRDYCNDVIAKTGTDYKTSTNGYTDTWYSGCGLEQDEYNTAKSKMLNSIKANGGFYIGKYETGIDDSSIAEDATTTAGLRTSSGDTTQTAVIKQNKEPYTYVTCSQAQNLAEGFATDGKTASLLFGIQWDLVLKFIKVKESLPDNTILTSNSTDWGNYYNTTYSITNANAWYSTVYGDNWTKGAYNKASNGTTLLTTGADSKFAKQNIYNLAGNVWEWTLEKTSNDNNPCARRGGSYNVYGDVGPASVRNSIFTTSSNSIIGFRVTLY